MQADHNAHRGGFIRRTTARGEDGAWIVVTIWDSAAAADADAGRDADAAFVSVIDGDSVRRRRWTTLD